MADKRIQDLTPATAVGLNDRFVLEQSGQAKSLTGQVLITDLAAALDGHGGISGVSYTPPVAPSLDGTLTITLADNTSYDVTITNGNGISSVAVAYGISLDGTDPTLVQSWSNTVVAPTDQYPYMWTRITLTYINGTSTVAYSVTAKAADPSISVGSVSAVSGAVADVDITNSGTTLNPVLDFDFTLPKGDKGDTGDYIEPIVSYGTSTAAATEPSTWYSSASSISYAAGNFIWKKTDYTLHDAQTVQSTKKEIIGYIGQNGSGSGTVTQITFNGDVFQDDGTGNVPMTVDAEDVGAIADPSTKSNGQVLTWDSNANAWVAANPATGNVNTVNNVGVTAGTTNVAITGADIPVSGSDNTPISSALSAVKPISEGGTNATTASSALTNLGAVAKAGDTMTGNLTVQKLGDTCVYVENTTPANAHKVALNAGASGRGGIWDSTHNKWLVDYDLSGNLELGGVKFNKTETLTITRTENIIATATQVGRLYAYKKNGILFLNGNLSLTTGVSTSSFVEIASIAGWSAVDGVYMCVPAQGSTGSDPIVTINITSSGKIQVYAPNAITSNTWYRFEVSIPTSD